ncbi:MAG: ABC transporter permease [Eggerthellaceae bacterium]|jgi:hypothetical protein
MEEKLAKIKFVVPVTVAVVLFCVMSLVIPPLLQGSPHEVPFAIVSLDEGVGSGKDSVNIGDTLVDRFTGNGSDPNSESSSLLSGSDGENSSSDGYSSSDSDSSSSSSSTISSDALRWTQLDSEQQARDALARNEYYGAIIISKDFTSSMLYDKMGIGSTPSVKVLLNRGKNPTVAATVKNTVSELLLGYGVGTEIEMVNDSDVGGGTLGPTLTVPMTVLSLTIMTLISSILLSTLVYPRRRATRAERMKAIGQQLLYAAALSALIALLALVIQMAIGGLTLPFGQEFSFLWFSCFCLIVAIVGLCDLSLVVGAIISAATFGLGMPTAVLAVEMLPTFYATWIYPWAPQRFMGNSLRLIIYQGLAPQAGDMAQLLITAGVGIIAFIVAVVLPKRPQQQNEQSAEAEPESSPAMDAA